MMQVFPVRLTKLNDKITKVPAIPKGESWQTYQSSEDDLKADNVGVVTPDGCIIFDVDEYKGVTNADIEAHLGCTLDWAGAFLQSTPSGGKHYAFATNAKLRQSQDIIRGFDTRASGAGWIATGRLFGK